jgi:hypothetical protein
VWCANVNTTGNVQVHPTNPPWEMPIATSYGVVFHDSASAILPSGRVTLIGFDSLAALAATSREQRVTSVSQENNFLARQCMGQSMVGQIPMQ